MDSLRSIYALSEKKAEKVLVGLRWGEQAQCPECAISARWVLKERLRYKCVCGKQFSATSESLLAGRKMKRVDLLAGAFMFVRGAKGVSSIQMAETLGVQQRTAWCLLNVFRLAISLEVQSLTLDGVVEIDGATFGGHRRLGNVGLRGKQSIDRESMVVRRYGNRRCIVVAKKRFGRTMPIVVKTEGDAKEELTRRIAPGSVLVTDGAHAWDGLAKLYELLRVEHAWSFSANGACTNLAESFFSGMRRMHMGIHHHMSHNHMHLYAAELAWKRDMAEMKVSPGEKMNKLLSLCLRGARS